MWGEAYEDRALRRPDGETVTGTITAKEFRESAEARNKVPARIRDGLSG